MSHCFALYRPDSRKPEILAAVDEALCAYLEVPVHPTEYVRRWFDCEGLGFALGMTRERQLEINPERAEIINFLYDNYRVENWRE